MSHGRQPAWVTARGDDAHAALQAHLAIATMQNDPGAPLVRREPVSSSNIDADFEQDEVGKMKLIRWIAAGIRCLGVLACWLGLSVGLLLTDGALSAPASPEPKARQILDAAGIQGGLIAHLGCGDGKLTAALQANDSCIVQGLDADVTAARQTIQSLGRYGKVTAEQWTGDRLPYVDNLVNLVVADDLGKLPMEEVLRVLAPGGVALIGGKKTVKPRPDTIDEWTHYLHDATGNAVAHDTVVSPPKYLQWVAGPEWSRTHSHMGSMMGLVSANGRVFAIADEGSIAYPNSPANWSLCARDAYNGVLLWRIPMHRYQDHMWRLKNGPAQLPRRLVAEADRVYVTLDINGPVSAVDAATGQVLYSCKASTGTEEIILDDGVLFLLVNPKRLEGDPPEPVVSDVAASSKTYGEYPKEVVAIEAATGEVLWRHTTPVLPMTLSADSRRVYLHDGTKILGLDRKTGARAWTTPPVACVRPILANFSPTLIVYRDVIVFTGGTSDRRNSRGATSAFDANTGKHLWTVPEAGSSSSSPTSLFGINGLVWYGDVGGGGRSREIVGLDLLTGERKQLILSDNDNLQYHARCYRNKATDKYFLSNIRGVEFVDLTHKSWDVNLTMRGGCSFGIMPANGMTYMTPHPCTCYIEAKLNGFYAAYGDPTPPSAKTPEPANRLTKGPGYETMNHHAAPVDYRGEWPVFRHDNGRSGSTTVEVPPQLRVAWQTTLGGRLSALTIAGGKVFVAAIDAHAVYALDSASGRIAWSFLTGARVDSPPTIYQGRAYFGCADGRVYCLNAADGALIWRFFAAGHDRQLSSNGQLESVYPLHGSVLIQSDILYCMAGRSMFLDGGIRFYRLDPVTGKELSLSVLNDIDPTTGKNLQDKVVAQTLPPALPDILSCDARFIYLRSQRFDFDGRRPEITTPSASNDLFALQKGETAHLFARGGFLEDAGFHRLFWTYGKADFGGHQGDPKVPPYTPTGSILAFNDTDVFGYAGAFKGGTIKNAVFSISKDPKPVGEYKGPPAGKKEAKGKRSAGESDGSEGPVPGIQLKYNWIRNCGLDIRALALAGRTLFLAGTEAGSSPRLVACSIAAGKTSSELELPAPPVWDGLAVGNSQVLVSTLDGKVICLGGK